MPKIVGKNSELRQKIIQELRRIIEESRGKLKPKLAIVYGSIARGDWHQGSDIDLLVISESAHPKFTERAKPLQIVVHGFPVEPRIYTMREFEQMLSHGRMTALDALTEGIIIYAEKSYMKGIREKLKQTIEKLKPEKTCNGWKLHITSESDREFST
ncbi:MAG: nucleotidyltransferase domain-containing protein [Candidatus Bathyarchaeia archaeon]